MSEETEEAVEEDDDEVAEEEPEGGGGGGGAKKLILFIVLPILLLAGAGAGVYFSGLLDPFLGAEPAEAEAKEEEVNEAETVGHYIDLDEMLVTLAGKGRKQSFLKLRVSLELKALEDEARVTAVMPRIIDNFQVFLRELRVEELQGSQGI